MFLNVVQGFNLQIKITLACKYSQAISKMVMQRSAIDLGVFLENTHGSTIFYLIYEFDVSYITPQLLQAV